MLSCGIEKQVLPHGPPFKTRCQSTPVIWLPLSILSLRQVGSMNITLLDMLERINSRRLAIGPPIVGITTLPSTPTALRRCQM